ncbi:hypothetical protein JCM3766R1_002504 [Sporobolomyces carnicolor]
MIGTVVASLIFSFYCLHAPVSPVWVVLLVASLSFSLKLFLSEAKIQKVSGPNFLKSLVSLAAGLALESAVAFLWSNISIFSDIPLSIFETATALVLYTLSTTVFPLSAIVAAEIFNARINSSTRARSYPVFVPALIFAIAGIGQERVAGVGRAIWWVRGTSQVQSSRLLSRLGGPILVDFVVASAGYSVAWILWSAFERGDDRWTQLFARDDAVAFERDLLRHESDNALEEGNGNVRATESREETAPLLPETVSRNGSSGSRKRSKLVKPLSIVAFLTLFQLICPLFTRPLLLSDLSPSSKQRLYPSPIEHPQYTYPPVPVGCVATPPIGAEDGKSEPASALKLLLKETRTVASRGAKVISWEEAAVGIVEVAPSQGHSQGRRGREGWESMGDAEKSVLRSVGDVANQYKVYILATYSIERLAHGAKYNVATLVGPSSSNSSSGVPHVIASTTKHHPVTFIESYAHSHRID